MLPEGIEKAYWNLNFPVGVFKLKVGRSKYLLKDVFKTKTLKFPDFSSMFD